MAEEQQRSSEDERVVVVVDSDAETVADLTRPLVSRTDYREPREEGMGILGVPASRNVGKPPRVASLDVFRGLSIAVSL
jgi:hypothetical protein